MDRREALKNISLAFGYTISAPVLMNILTSCNTEKQINSFTFFNQQEGFMIKNCINFVFDEKNFPPVKSMNLPLFIDDLFNATANKKEKELFKQSSLEFENKFISIFKKKPLDGSFEEYSSLLHSYYNLTEDKKNIILNTLDKNIETIESKSEKSTFLIYHFLLTIREKALFGYCTSEEFLS